MYKCMCILINVCLFSQEFSFAFSDSEEEDEIVRFRDENIQLLQGDVLDVLKTLPPD
eukprot:SAG11_NODE_21734_length_419_cov_2.087500_1_plen_56_part_10